MVNSINVMLSVTRRLDVEEHIVTIHQKTTTKIIEENKKIDTKIVDF